MKITHSFVAAVLASFVFAIALSEAAAVDTTTYPGTICEALGPGTPSIWYSTIGNSASVDLNMDCPIVRQHTDRTVASGSVARVFDRHFSEDICCNVASVHLTSVTSGFIWSSGDRCSEGSSSNEQVLSFGSVGANSHSHQYLGCKIPPVYSGAVSRLNSFTIVEND